MDLIWYGIRQAFRILGTGDRDVWQITLRSLWISGSATAIALALGVGAGALLAFRRLPGSPLSRLLGYPRQGAPPRRRRAGRGDLALAQRPARESRPDLHAGGDG